MTSERGIAIVFALMAILLLSALGSAFVLTTSTESLIAANFRNGIATRHAARAIAELSIASLSNQPDWDAVLAGVSRSMFADGAPAGQRLLSDGTVVDLSSLTNLASCGKSSGCTDGEMNVSTSRRPWGPNNPRWQLYAYGYLPRGASESGDGPTPFYVVSLVGDDALETDGDPFRDGRDPTNPGSGLIALRVEAFGPRGAHATAELTIGRPSALEPAQVLAWREPG